MMVGQASPYPRRSIHTSTGDIRLYQNRERYWTELCFSHLGQEETRFFNHYFCCWVKIRVVAYLLLLVVLEDLGLGTDLGLAYEHQNLSIPNIKI